MTRRKTFDTIQLLTNYLFHTNGLQTPYPERLILKEMISDPDRWFLCSDFCGGDQSLPFVGYKAPTRMSELQMAGVLTSRWSTRKTELGTRLKEYKLSGNHATYLYEDLIEFVAHFSEEN